MAAEDNPTLTIHSRADLRDWLSANHATASATWLALWKKPRPGYLP